MVPQRSSVPVPPIFLRVAETFAVTEDWVTVPLVDETERLVIVKGVPAEFAVTRTTYISVSPPVVTVTGSEVASIKFLISPPTAVALLVPVMFKVIAVLLILKLITSPLKNLIE